MTALLGKTVRDKLTGMIGIADTYTEMLSGTIQYGIQPQGDGKTKPEGISTDEQQIEEVAGSAYLTRGAIDPDVKIELGDRVRDLISGFEGIATLKTTFINGCVYFRATGNVENGDILHTAPEMFSSHRQFEIIEKGAFDALRKKAEPKPSLVKRLTGQSRKATDPEPEAKPATRPPGGPSMANPRAC